MASKQKQLSLLLDDEVPMFPEELKKEIIIAEHKTFTLQARPWSDLEEDWAWDLYEQGYNYSQIAKSLGRENSSSVPLKMKRLKKAKNKYNDKHKEDKYYNNKKFLLYMGESIQTVLDCFCGEKKYYSDYKVHNNDINTKIEADTNLDTDVLLKQLVSKNVKFDLVDLDPYGASITYLDDALKIAKKAIVMTLGELGHRRWKRLDFISKHYDINKVEDININKLVQEIIKKAKTKNITLLPIIIADYNHIGRVWFEIKK